MAKVTTAAQAAAVRIVRNQAVLMEYPSLERACVQPRRKTPWPHRYSRAAVNIPEGRSDILQIDGGQGGFAAGIAFPQMADFAALDEFGDDRSDQLVAASRTAHRAGKGADGGKLRRLVLHLHASLSLSGHPEQSQGIDGDHGAF